MIVQKSQLVTLFEAMDVRDAKDWPLNKLAAKVNQDKGIGRYLDPGQSIADADSAKLFDDIKEAQERGELIEVADDAAEPGGTEPAAAAPKTKPKPKAKPAAKPSTNGHAKATKPKPKAKPAAKPTKTPAKGKASKGRKKVKWRDKIALWKKTPAKMTERGPGVFRAILEELKAATEKQPVTKQELLGILTEKFPKRKQSKMLTSINNLVPSRLAYKWGIEVKRKKMDDGHLGYWIPKTAKK